MANKIDFSVSPYFDDYDPSKGFHKILFKPGLGIQTRELNQLQSIVLKQVERFGDSIFQNGTIVDGCQFTFSENYPYVKIRDEDSSGEAITISDWQGLYAIDENTGLTAEIRSTTPGFVATAPDLNTLYVRYSKAGSNGEISFLPNTNIVVTRLDRRIESLNVQTSVGGFTNNDIVVIMPAITVSNTIGGITFANGTPITDIVVPGAVITQNLNIGQAKAVITDVNTTVIPNNITVKIRPLANSLTGNAYSNGLFLVENSFEANSVAPAVVNGSEIIVTNVLGSGASANVVTSSTGRINPGKNSLKLNSGGSEYDVSPFVSVASATANTSQVTNLVVEARNYVSKVIVAPQETNPIGFGYAFSISDGVVYQKGSFIKVNPQTILVEKYGTVSQDLPDGKVIGFYTEESIVNSNIDLSLLDNATTAARSAPGADRLKYEPKLIVLPKEEAEANTEFFSLVEFINGNPYKKIPDPKFNAIEDEFAKRTFETTGNFVLDRFLVNTATGQNTAFDSEKFIVTVDPGQAYINGRRVSSSNTTNIFVDKANITETKRSVIDINLGNYIEVTGLAGIIPVSKIPTIKLYSGTSSYYTTPGAVITAPSNQIGEARVRGLEVVNGVEGTPEARYRVYLFNIKMNSGSSFDQVKSIFYDGTTQKAIASVFGTAALKETANNALVFDTKFKAVKTLSSANVVFTSRVSEINVACNGISTNATLSISAGPNSYFPYSGELTDAQMREIIISPNANVVSNTSITGTVTGTSGQNTITGTSTQFINEVYPGAYLTVGSQLCRVSSVTNNTHLALGSNLTGSFSANAAFLTLPRNIPVSLANLPNATARVQANTILQIGLGFVSTTPVFGASIVYNKNKNVSSDSASKPAKRKIYVKIQANTHPDTNVGPWCLGVPDVFRLRKVYRGSNTSSPEITSSFYVDNNHNENFVDLSYLVKIPGSKDSVGSDDILLVEFDAFENPSDRPLTIDSYDIDDSIAFNDANTGIYTIETPQFFAINGKYYDLRDNIDFRPVVANTANLNANTTTATVNPSSVSIIEEALDKVIPSAQGDLEITAEYYLPRIDKVLMTANGELKVIKGNASLNPSVDLSSDGSITLDIIEVPQYPSIPLVKSSPLREIYELRVGSERLLNERNNIYLVKKSKKYNISQAQNRRYTMSDVASIDNRLSNVERIVALNLNEQKISDLVIPSSIDENISRFKFGFAVDTFTDESLLDKDNPQFNATVFSGRLGPKKKISKIYLKSNTNDLVQTLPRISDFRIVSQNIATDGPVEIPEEVPSEPPPPVVPPPPPAPSSPVMSTIYNAFPGEYCGFVPGSLVRVESTNIETAQPLFGVTLTADFRGCIGIAPKVVPIPPPEPIAPPVRVDPPIVVPPSQPEPPILDVVISIPNDPTPPIQVPIEIEYPDPGNFYDPQPGNYGYSYWTGDTGAQEKPIFGDPGRIAGSIYSASEVERFIL